MLNKFTDIQVGGTANTMEDQDVIRMGWIIFRTGITEMACKCNTVLLFEHEMPQPHPF